MISHTGSKLDVSVENMQPELMKDRQLVSIKRVVDLKRCSVTIDILVHT